MIEISAEENIVVPTPKKKEIELYSPSPRIKILDTTPKEEVKKRPPMRQSIKKL